MKIAAFIIFIFLSLPTFADCNENWEEPSLVQIVNHYNVNSKSFFYSAPNEKNKSTHLFLITGDKFFSYLKSGDFIFGSYIKKNGSVVNGWLKKQTLNETSSEKKSLVPKISKSDVVIISAYGDIELGSSYEQFYKKWGQCELNKQPDIGILGNFITKGDNTYKYFDNYWKGFTIRSSNINFQQIGSDFNTYRITTITVTNSKYMTSRGVYVGLKAENITNAYGEPSYKAKSLMSYKFKYYTLDFILDNGIIKSIKMDEQIQ